MAAAAAPGVYCWLIKESETSRRHRSASISRHIQGNGVRHQRLLRGHRRRPVRLPGALYQSGKLQCRPVDFDFLSMVVIGGLGLTIGGSIVGGGVLWHRSRKRQRGIKDAPGLVFGLLLVLVMVFMPQGLVGLARRLGEEGLR